MLDQSKIQPSPSRTYVAICCNTNFDGHYFRKFNLPTHFVEGWETDGAGTGTWAEGSYSHILPNKASAASWYFLNKLNFVACILYAIPYEQYTNLIDQDEKNEEVRKMIMEVVEEAPVPPAESIILG